MEVLNLVNTTSVHEHLTEATVLFIEAVDTAVSLKSSRKGLWLSGLNSIRD